MKRFTKSFLSAGAILLVVLTGFGMSAAASETYQLIPPQDSSEQPQIVFFRPFLTFKEKAEEIFSLVWYKCASGQTGQTIPYVPSWELLSQKKF